MKRSQINALIAQARALMEAHGLALPPFADWSPADWAACGSECDEIRDNALGWDVTDFGSGEFEKVGLLLFTLRNGNRRRPQRYPKPYAEKLMVSLPGQCCPLHFHWHKMEDIINRGGGTLEMQLFGADAADAPDADAPVEVVCDGVRRQLAGGALLRLAPGQSVTLTPRLYHSFWAAAAGGPVLAGEVSQCNDDEADNCFWPPRGRFPTVEEDEPARWLLCNEYPPAAR